MDIRPVAADLFNAKRRTDRQADVKKLIVTFRNFVNAPKNLLLKKDNVFTNFVLWLCYLINKTFTNSVTCHYNTLIEHT